MRLVKDDSENVANWVANLLPETRHIGFNSCKAIGVVSNDGAPLGGAVFHDWHPHFSNIGVSCAAVSPRWLTRNIISEILSYPFEGIGVFKVWGAVSIHNARSIKLIQGLGFTKEATIRHHFGRKNHAVVFGMTQPEFAAKYRKERYDESIQQAQSAHAA